MYSRPRFPHLTDWPGATARSGSYRRAGPALSWQGKHRYRFRRRVLMQVIADHPDRDEESFADVDELLVEEVSIDGMCGVY